MSEEAVSRPFFFLRNGNAIADEDMAQKICMIKEFAPENRPDGDSLSSGFEWNEIGMANLFSELYRNEARYCPENKSWYTYHEGAWRRDEGAILVSEKLKDFVRCMVIYCGEIVDDDKRKAYSKFVNSMGDRRMRDNDVVLQFLETCCEQKEGKSIRAKDLYSRYRSWAKSEYGWTLTAQKFNAEMERHSEWFDRITRPHGYMTYYGLTVKELL